MTSHKTAPDTGETCWQAAATYLVLVEGGSTPDRCVKCNAPARGYLLTRKYKPRLGLIRLIMLCGGVKRESMTVRLALCPSHRARRTKWMRVFLAAIGSGAIMLVAGTVLIVSATKHMPVADAKLISGLGLTMVGTVLLTMGAIFFGVVWETVEYGAMGEGKLVLKGADEAFLKSLPKAKTEP